MILPPLEKWMGGRYFKPLIWFSVTFRGEGIRFVYTRRFSLRKLVE